MLRLTRRQDFLAAAKARSYSMQAFVMQMREREDGKPARLGFTCTKKLGNAVARNRIRRRLKEAARLSLEQVLQLNCDYVVIGRASAEARPFEMLCADLISAATQIHSRSSNSKPSTIKPATQD